MSAASRKHGCGESYAYLARKAALNGIGKGITADWKEKGVVVVRMYPGYGKTDLDTNGRTHHLKEVVEPHEAAEKLWKVCMGKGIEETGVNWHREGTESDWDRRNGLVDEIWSASSNMYEEYSLFRQIRWEVIRAVDVAAPLHHHFFAKGVFWTPHRGSYEL